MCLLDSARGVLVCVCVSVCVCRRLTRISEIISAIVQFNKVFRFFFSRFRVATRERERERERERKGERERETK